MWTSLEVQGRAQHDFCAGIERLVEHRAAQLLRERRDDSGA
jgi:hypothetical protein